MKKLLKVTVVLGLAINYFAAPSLAINHHVHYPDRPLLRQHRAEHRAIKAEKKMAVKRGLFF